MPRVTEVLDGLLEQDFVGYIEKNSKAKRLAIREEAFRVGRTVDEIIQLDIKDGGYLAPEGDEPVLRCLEAWELFKKDYPLFVPQVVSMQEEMVVDDITGHYDFFVERDGEWGIVDLKCASGIRPKYWTQTAQYSEMKMKLVERLKNKPRFIGVLRLDKQSGLYEYKEIVDETFIRYEVEVFNAYYLTFTHAQAVRDQIRNQLEEELLDEGGR